MFTMENLIVSGPKHHNAERKEFGRPAMFVYVSEPNMREPPAHFLRCVLVTIDSIVAPKRRVFFVFYFINL